MSSWGFGGLVGEWRWSWSCGAARSKRRNLELQLQLHDDFGFVDGLKTALRSRLLTYGNLNNHKLSFGFRSFCRYIALLLPEPQPIPSTSLQPHTFTPTQYHLHLNISHCSLPRTSQCLTKKSPSTLPPRNIPLFLQTMTNFPPSNSRPSR